MLNYQRVSWVITFYEPCKGLQIGAMACCAIAQCRTSQTYCLGKIGAVSLRSSCLAVSLSTGVPTGTSTLIMAHPNLLYPVAN